MMLTIVSRPARLRWSRLPAVPQGPLLSLQRTSSSCLAGCFDASCGDGREAAVLWSDRRLCCRRKDRITGRINAVLLMDELRYGRRKEVIGRREEKGEEGGGGCMIGHLEPPVSFIQSCRLLTTLLGQMPRWESCTRDVWTILDDRHGRRGGKARCFMWRRPSIRTLTNVACLFVARHMRACCSILDVPSPLINGNTRCLNRSSRSRHAVAEPFRDNASRAALSLSSVNRALRVDAL